MNIILIVICVVLSFIAGTHVQKNIYTLRLHSGKLVYWINGEWIGDPVAFASILEWLRKLKGD